MRLPHRPVAYYEEVAAATDLPLWLYNFPQDNAHAPHGHLFLFGLPEDHYVVPMRQVFRKQLIVHGGATLDWPRFWSRRRRT